MKDYNEEKYYKMIRNKQLIYTNQLKRLSKNHKRANFILIYYSMALIVYTITLKYYGNYFNANFSEYTSLILSIIILIYSIINSNSRYTERIQLIEKALKDIKILKRKLGSMVLNTETASEDRKKEFNDLKNEYNHIEDRIEYRDDLDFYYTVSYLCKKLGINIHNGKDKKTQCDLSSLNMSAQEIQIFKDEVRGYILEINPLTQKLNIMIHFIWHFILYTFPIAIMIICFVTKHKIF